MARFITTAARIAQFIINTNDQLGIIAEGLGLG